LVITVSVSSNMGDFFVVDVVLRWMFWAARIYRLSTFFRHRAGLCISIRLGIPETMVLLRGKLSVDRCAIGPDVSIRQ